MFKPRTVQLKETFQHFLSITVVCGVLHLDVLHDGRDSPGLNGRGCVVLTSVLALTSGENLHVSEDRLGVTDVEGVLRGQLLVVGSGLEPETSPVVLDSSVVRVVEWKTFDTEVGMEVTDATSHPPTTEVTVVN